MYDVMDSKVVRATRSPVARGVLVALLATLALGGCGGGGGGASTPTSNTGGSGSGSGSGSGGSGSDGSGSGGSGSGGSGSGGSGGTDTKPPVVYLAEQDTPEVTELYMVTTTGPVKLNGPLIAGGWVRDFEVSPNGEFAVYRADQDTLDRSELYVVNIANPGASTKLNPSLTVDRDVEDFGISPDSNFVVYTADQDIPNRSELYLVNRANPGSSARLNAELTVDRDVTGFAIGPGSDKVVYRADPGALDRYELLLVDVANPGSASIVNSPLVAGGSVSSAFAFSPNGSAVAYLADQQVDERRELFATPVATPGQSTRLNGELTAEGDVCRFEFSHDSTRIAYCGDQETDGVMELFIVSLDTPGSSQKLNPTLVEGGNVGSAYDFAPDDSFIVYEATQEVVDRNELYRVDLATPGAATKLNAPIVAAPFVDSEGEVWHGVYMFHIRPDGAHVAYAANQDVSDVWELYDVDLANPGTATKLNPAMSGEGLWDFRYAADGGKIVYMAAQDNEFYDLFGVEPATPGVASKLNGALATGGDVWDFAIVP